MAVFRWCDCWDITTSYVTLPNGNNLCIKCYNELLIGEGKVADFLKSMRVSMEDFCSLGICDEGIRTILEKKLKRNIREEDTLNLIKELPEYTSIIVNTALLKWEISK